jgi:hypothetical protein
MTTVYFGEYWDVPVLVNADQAPTPVGEPCMCRPEDTRAS